MMKRQALSWLSFVWLLCGLGVASYYMVDWISKPLDPLRNETLVGVAIAFIYTLPAVVVTLILSSRRFALSTGQRRIGAFTAGVLLLLFAFSATSTAAPNNALQATRENARA